MADSKISALTELAERPALDDEFVVVDKSDTTMAASGTDKRVKRQYLGAYTLAASGVAVTAPADTAENTLATITVPANTLGPNGLVRVSGFLSYTNSADDKIVRLRYSGASGTQFISITLTTSLTYNLFGVIQNRNVTNSQVGGQSTSGVGPGSSSGAGGTVSAVDTTASSTVVITGQKETSGDTLKLERYLVEVIPAA